MSARKFNVFRWIAIISVVVGFIILVAPLSVFAHGESIAVDPPKAMPGDSVTITGSEFEAGTKVSLSLESARGTVPLGDVNADEAGSFTYKAAMPKDISSGSFQLVAVTADDRLTVDLAITTSSEAAAAAANGGSQITFQRSPAETIAIGIIVAALVIAGSFLIRASTERRQTAEKVGSLVKPNYSQSS